MVGIPRSKGCKTCRKRKVKCDEQRPSCGQCRKGARECGGYHQPTIFRHSSTYDFDVAASAAALSGDQSVGDVVWVDGHEPPDPTKQTMPPPRRKRPDRRAHPYAIARAKRAPPQPAGATPLLRAPNPLVGAVQSITGQFLRLCVPPSAAQEAPLAWLGEVGEAMRGDVDALPLALSALALGWAGRVREQPPLADTSLRLYDAAVRQLRGDMGAYSPRQSLVVTAVFVAFELCQFGSRGNPGWLTHMQGVAAFLQALGPANVSTDPYLKIYAFCRVVFIMQGLTRRRRVCAGSQMWIDGPFRNHKKSPYHRFYDVAAEVCEALGQADDLRLPDNGPSAGDAEAEQVLRKMRDLVSRLENWRRESDIIGFNGPLRYPNDELLARHRLDRARARGYPTELPPDSGWTSDALYGQRMMHNYQTLRLDLYMTILDNPALRSRLEASDQLRAQLLADLERTRRSSEPGPAPSIAALISEECGKLARDIVVSCPSTCHSAYQNFGSLVTVYTLETAIRWFEGHGDEDASPSPMDVELERYCRAVLAGIKAEESKDPCPFEVSVLTDEVLRQNWC
ncbi:hypothetical protein F4802DRAFT_604414 [Xylaria palmicola]|nr:hypothetical protein F4802DRAFT_604414 [Xylaria palmicola]